MVGQNPNRTSYTPRIDVALLREIINHNPFVDAAKWADVVDAVKDMGETAPTTARSVRERATLLLEYFKKDQMTKINKSGTNEEYTEREELLQEVLDLFNDRERTKKALKTHKKVTSATTDIRKRAMETLKDVETDETEGPDMTDGENGDTEKENLQSPSCKRVRVTPSMAKREMMSYLETKNDNLRSQHEQELAFKKQELELSKSRFALEKKEREEKMEAEKKVRNAAQDIQERTMALKREELEMSKAPFELEKNEREARIESDKRDKALMHDMMKTILANQNK